MPRIIRILRFLFLLHDYKRRQRDRYFSVPLSAYYLNSLSCYPRCFSSLPLKMAVSVIRSYDVSIANMISGKFHISVRIVILNCIQLVNCFFLGSILTGSNHIPFLAVQIAPICGSKNKALKAV